jgi:hypothetical protein
MIFLWEEGDDPECRIGCHEARIKEILSKFLAI